MEKAVFGGGCFWCTEAIFKRIKGVGSVVSGYAGGKKDNPNYQEVVSGSTGHAEAIEITFDPKKISFKDLCFIFFRTHDPTTLNRQGADVGEQYRSVIFYTDDNQKKVAEKELEEAQNVYDSPIVTQIVPLNKFYPAEDYHQDYYASNPTAGYCRVVIDPKIKKLQSQFIHQQATRGNR